jgi:hypothetical protein
VQFHGGRDTLPEKVLSDIVVCKIEEAVALEHIGIGDSLAL